MSEQPHKNSLEIVVDNSSAAEPVIEASNEKPVGDHPLEKIDLSSSEYFENRELNYLKFNLRVLNQAKIHKHPLLERLIFLLIFSSNLDEFYEIRVSGLKKQLDFGRQRPGADGKYPEQILKEIHEQVREALAEQYRILNDDLLPSLAEENIHFVRQLMDEIFDSINFVSQISIKRVTMFAKKLLNNAVFYIVW